MPSTTTDGALWLDTDGVAPGLQSIRWSKTLAAGVTVISGNDANALPLEYVAGYEQVFYNGVLLVRGDDYTATNGTTITLSAASFINDVVEVIAVRTVQLTDTFTQAQVNSKLDDYSTSALMGAF